MSKLEINLANLAENFKKIQDRAGSEAGVMAVVKANAYGHGLERVVKTLAAAGCRWLAVNSLAEAVQIRSYKIDTPILILGPVDSADFGQILSGDFRLTIDSQDSLEFLNTKARIYGKRSHIHIKVNTGMNRFGINVSQAKELVEKALGYQNILVEGIYSHFYGADPACRQTGVKSMRAQWQLFNEVLFDLQKQGIEVTLRHLANSAAILAFDVSFFELVRPGVLLYGLVGQKELGVKPVLAWKAKIVKIRPVGPGECLSYNCAFKAKKNLEVAVIDVGYAEGFSRALSNQARVLVAGKRCPVIGMVNMNYTLVDITAVRRVAQKTRPKLDDEVVLIGQQGEEEILAQELADWSGTIVYEVVSRLPEGLTRIYS